MKGQILDYSIQSGTGTVTGDDGKRYTFVAAEWNGTGVPARGMTIDFDVEENNAKAIYPALGGQGTQKKDKLTAGLLAIFLGWLGIHKFYLGYTGPALVYLLVNTVGWFLTVWLLGIPNMILGVMALVEGILYLTKSDEEFNETYVINKKQWF